MPSQARDKHTEGAALKQVFSYLAGTSRPTKYAVLLDENNFSADELQQFTYHTCYTYVRSTRAVSMAPAAYYAHLLAARARCFIDDGTSAQDTGAREQLSNDNGLTPPFPPPFFSIVSRRKQALICQARLWTTTIRRRTHDTLTYTHTLSLCVCVCAVFHFLTLAVCAS
eukprot:COSAG06_NODE_4573_length_4134_cov_2.409271_2_plen_169_part_00